MRRTRSKARQAKSLLSAWGRLGIALDRADSKSPVAAGIAYVTGSKVLLIQRGKDTKAYPETWSFPGGHIEPGESPDVAAARESYEEIAHFPENLTPVVGDGVFALFACKGSEFTPILNEESLQYAWADYGALPAPLHPGVAEQLQAVIAKFAPASAQDKRDTDINGYATIPDNPLSKVGVFEYRGSQIPDAPDKDAVYKVYRPAEELGSKETVDSFKLSPWIDNHVMLGSEDEGLTPPEKKGVQGVIGEDVYFKDDVLYGNLRVFSQAMKSAIDKQGKRELSCGYRCRYEATPGTYKGQAYDYIQREIRGNHLALVDEGRMGPEVAVQDQADRFVFTCDSSSFQSSEVKNMDISSSATPGGGATGEVTLESVVAQLNALVKAVAMLKSAQGGADPANPNAAADPVAGDDDDADPDMAGDADPMSKLSKTVDALCARMDAYESKGGAADGSTDMPGTGDPNPKPAKDDPAGTNKGDGAVLETAATKAAPAAMDAKAMDAAVEKRVRESQAAIVAKTGLYDRVSKFVGAFDHSLLLTEAEVAGYACKKLKLTPAKGAELATLNGYLHGRTPDSKAPVAAMDAAASPDWLNAQIA
jgi:hypothetical protein